MSSHRHIGDRDWGRRALSPKRRKSIGALAEAILSTEDETGLHPAEPEIVTRAVDQLDLLVGAGSTDLHRGYRLLAWLIEWIPLLIIGAFSRASRLPLARRLAYLEALERSKLPLLPTLLVVFKLPITMVTFEVDPHLRETGFDRSTIATPRVLPVLVPREEAHPVSSTAPSGTRLSRPPAPIEGDAGRKTAEERT
jgi:hypothetical protein